MASNTETFTQDSYNRGGLITFVISMGVSILFFIGLLIFHPGVDLHEVGNNGKKVPTTNSPATATAPQDSSSPQTK